MGASEYNEAVWRGEEIPNVNRPCARPGCGGTFVPKGEPDWDNDGSAMIGLVCNADGCGMESYASWDWEGYDHLDDEEKDEDENGDVRDVWAEVDADLRHRGVIW